MSVAYKENLFWCLLKTKVRQERRAKEHLERQKIRVFCPEIELESIKTGGTMLVSEILFPGYLFIEISESTPPLSIIRSTRGVQNFVSFGGSVAKVPLALISDLESRIENSEKNVISRLPKKGDNLLVMRGSFKGLNVIFNQPDGDQRAIVLMKIMNQEIKASFRNSDLCLK